MQLKPFFYVYLFADQHVVVHHTKEKVHWGACCPAHFRGLFVLSGTKYHLLTLGFILLAYYARWYWDGVVRGINFERDHNAHHRFYCSYDPETIIFDNVWPTRGRIYHNLKTCD